LSVVAERTGRNPESPLPARELVLGWQIPYQVDLGNGIRLTGVADLATRALPEAGEKAVVLEVHDYHAQPRISASWASRDIRVIAAALARPMDNPRDDAGQPITWEQVDRVIYVTGWWPGIRFAVEYRPSSGGGGGNGARISAIHPRALTGRRLRARATQTLLG
jgi:hypothetical protein